VVFFDGAEYWLADGFHRIIAAETLGLVEIAADVRPGGRRDAILYAVGANAAHGLKRTNRDKRNAVMVLLKDPEWDQWSDREIARRCAVSDRFVNGVRAVLTPNIRSEPRTYTTKHGTTSTMTVSNIGARPAPAPAAAAVADERQQTDIEDFAPSLARAPAWPPEHTAPAGQIRYVINMLDDWLKLTPAQAAAAFIGEIRKDAEQLARGGLGGRPAIMPT
jgi:hypothetical protein